MSEIFERLKRVDHVTAGFSGGSAPNPSYERASTGTTGHAELSGFDRAAHQRLDHRRQGGLLVEVVLETPGKLEPPLRDRKVHEDRNADLRVRGEIWRSRLKEGVLSWEV